MISLVNKAMLVHPSVWPTLFVDDLAAEMQQHESFTYPNGMSEAETGHGRLAVTTLGVSSRLSRVSCDEAGPSQATSSGFCRVWRVACWFKRMCSVSPSASLHLPEVAA